MIKILVMTRDVITATGICLQGITRASLQTKSFISATFQETTKIIK
jgi:hypothetical protein